LSGSIISLKSVFAGYDGRHVVENIDLEVAKGDYLGVIGPNGGGKTTVLRLIAGVMKPSHGEVRVFGVDPYTFKSQDRRRIGYVRQETNIDTSFPVSVLDTVLMGLYALIGPAKPIGRVHVEMAMEALKKTGMDAFAHSHIGALSGGQKQRVFISRGIVNNPELLILDEPTTGIDAKNQNAFYKMLLDLKKEMNLTIIMVSHDISMIADQVNKVSCVNHRIHVHGESEDVLTNEQACEVCGIDTDYIFHGKKIKILKEHDK
jgi:zinc transport system ATP-binding protein